MSRARSGIITLGTVLMVGALLWVLYYSIEFYEETEKSQWSIAAIRDPYLAAQKFMIASGVEVIETDTLSNIDSLDHVSTLLITEASQISQQRQLESILSWLDKGGSLIVTANRFSIEDDLLLTEFGVDVDFPKREDDNADEEKPSISEALREYNDKIDQGMTPEEIAESGLEEASLTEIDFGDPTGSVQIHFNPNRVLTHAYIDGSDDNPAHQPFSWSSSEFGVHMIQFDVGAGLLTIISDPTIWQSQNIAKHDHAYLLWILSAHDGNFAILRSFQRDSLWVLAMKNAPEFLVALACLVVFSLWFLGHRFGRIIPAPNQSGRALSEHFSATAGYLWHRKAVAALLGPVREEIMRRAHLKIPGFSRADADARFGLIAAHCKLDRETVRTIMQTKKLNESAFVSTVKLLKQIEQSL